MSDHVFDVLSPEEQQQLFTLLAKIGASLNSKHSANQQIHKQGDTDSSNNHYQLSHNGDPEHYAHFDRQRLQNSPGGCGARQHSSGRRTEHSAYHSHKQGCGCHRY